MTRKPPNNNAEKPLAGKLAGQLLLLSSLAVFMGGGFVMAARVVPPLLHVDMDQKVSGLGTVMAILFACCVLAIFLVYVSVAVWMLVARLFLPRATIYAIMTSGPTWRFDHWLFNLICPDDKPR